MRSRCVLVFFHGRAKSFYPWDFLTSKDYRHTSLVIRDCSDKLIFLEWGMGFMDLIVLHEKTTVKDVIGSLKDVSMVLKYYPVQEYTQSRFHPLPWNCVQIAKAVIGVRWRWVLTPKQLAGKLLSTGADIVWIKGQEVVYGC